MSALVFRHNPTAALLSSWFDKVLSDQASGGEDTSAYRMQPRMDISEEDEKYHVTMDIPGLTKDDVSIKVENGVIKIEGERKEAQKGKYHHAERVYGKFLRSFTLPEEVDSAKIEAKVANGVLELTLPKSKKALPVEVKIS